MFGIEILTSLMFPFALYLLTTLSITFSQMENNKNNSKRIIHSEKMSNISKGEN